MRVVTLQINKDRLYADFVALAAIGATPGGGVNRPALSEAHLAARRWFLGQAQAAGLDTAIDTAGNHSAILNCAQSGAPTLLLGSHLDSVPQGGRFDGALGVTAALEVLRVVQENGIVLPVNLEAIDFTDEEGTLFGLLGSSALSGNIQRKELNSPRGGREAFIQGLLRAGLTEEGLLAARRDPRRLAGYLELHIEQGSRLEKASIPIGVVSAIVGIGSYQLAFIGQANHAGTTTMQERRDAAQGAAAFILEARRLVLAQFPGCVVNIGQVELMPGAFNIIPGRAELSLEFRAADEATFERLEQALLICARNAASQCQLEYEEQPRGRHLPTPLSTQAQAAIISAAEELGLKHLVLASGAGHDAQMLAALCPAGMVFIPSVGGISHSHLEFSTWQDCLNGANVLLRAALKLASRDKWSERLEARPL